MNDKEKLQNLIKSLLKILDVNLADFMLRPIYAKIDTLTDDEINKTIILLKSSF